MKQIKHLLNYHSTSLLFIGLLLIYISLDIFFDLPAVIYLILYLLYSAIFFYGVFTISANFFIPVKCSAVNNQQKVIALSFDDGPSTYTLEILNVLQNYQIQAAFFCIGQRILDNKSICQEINRLGHIIGNHSYSHHLLFDLFLTKNMLKDLEKMDNILFDTIQRKPLLFRPPFGVVNPCLKNAIIKGGYVPIGWSVRSLDTVAKDKLKLLHKVKSALSPGAIYLFHDTQAITLAILPEFIEYALTNGYQIVRLDKMLGLPAYKS